MGLVVIEIDSANLLSLVSIFSFSIVSKLSQPLDLVNVLILLFLQLCHFIAEVVDLLPNLISVVGFVGQVSLGCGDFHLLPVDLVSVGSDFLLNIVV